jgi:Protein of unknown function (DUF2800)
MSPSKIEQFSICAASFQASQGLPDISKPDAVQGTAAHEIHERCLTTGYSAATYKDDVVIVEEPDRKWSIPVDDEMVYYVQESVDRCNELPGLTFVEVRVDISEFTPLPEQSGSSDYFSIDEPSRTLYVVDFKYGKGVRVDAYLNPQMIYYALGVLRGLASVFRIERVVIMIHQPRIDNWDRWETTPGELVALGRHHKRLLSRCLLPNPPYHPDAKACKFCKAATQCKARVEHVHRLAAGLFDDLDEDIVEFETPWPVELPKAELLTVEQLITVRRHSPLVTSFLKAVNDRLLHMLIHSEDVPDLKLVEGKSNRRYRDKLAERQAAAYLLAHGADITSVIKTETVSPSQAVRLLPKEARKEFGDAYVVKPPGRPTVAPIDDRRPAYTLTVDAQFDDLDADDDGDI